MESLKKNDIDILYVKYNTRSYVYIHGHLLTLFRMRMFITPYMTP